MDEFLKMDIFFVVTTVAVVVMTLLLAVVLIRVIRILKHLEEVSVMVSEEGEKLRKDLDDVRQNVRREGMQLQHIASFLTGGKKRSSRSKKTTTSNF